MSVRFVIGRAGTGKTYRCLQAIRERLTQNPIDGPRLIFLVPEQASLQMERALAAPQGLGDGEDMHQSLGAVHRAEVLSFRRLAHRVLDSVGDSNRQALSESSRAMVLRHLLMLAGDELQYYRRVRHLRGLFDRLDATVAEWIEERISPDVLRTALPVEGENHSPFAAKMHDLRVLYEAYLRYLSAGRLDPSQHLEFAREQLPRCSWLAGAELWVDGFASLSAQEAETLVTLAQMCTAVEVTVMMDPSCVDGSSSSETPSEIAEVFARTVMTFRDVHRRFSKAGVEIETPLLLTPTVVPRFRRSPTLMHVERNLFSTRRESLTPPEGTWSGIELVTLPNRRLEVDYAVSRVCQWIQDPTRRYRFRDVAIIARDLAPYHELLSGSLNAHGIPFFLDRRRSIAHHALVEWLRSVVALSREDFSLSAVRLLLKSGLLPLTAQACDELENYLLAYGLSGTDHWRRGPWTISTTPKRGEADSRPGDRPEEMARLNAARRTTLGVFEAWIDFGRAAPRRAGSEWAAALVNLLDRSGVSEVFLARSREAEDRGDLNEAEEHIQVWRVVNELLADLASSFGDMPLTLDELSDVLDSGLNRLSLGLTPPMLDQVLVGSIDRSRHPDIKAAVLLGFNDGVFPQPWAEDSILNDDDRELLVSSGIGVRPPARERVQDERLLVYTALTRASEALVVTYTRADESGKALQPSSYVPVLQQACPGLEVTAVSDPVTMRQTWPVLSHRDLARQLAVEFRTRQPIEADDPVIRGRWNALYELLRADSRGTGALDAALRSLNERRAALLSPSSVGRAYPTPLQTSVSRLESFAACPFQHFAKYVLALRERAMASLAPVDVGRVYHAVLEDFVGGLTGEPRGFRGLTEEALLDRLREGCRRVAERLHPDPSLSSARDQYVLRRSSETLQTILKAQKAIARSGHSRPFAVELPFGFEQHGGLPGFEFSTPEGRMVRLRGYIDRVDVAEFEGETLGIVIDYKRKADTKLDLAKVFHGLSLQLATYLLVLAEHGRSETGERLFPAAALYIGLTPRYEKADRIDEPNVAERSLPSALRPRGIVLAESFGALDGGDQDGWSKAYAVHRKRDGTTGYVDSSDAAEYSDFAAVLAHAKAKLGQWADQMLEGRVAVNPYRMGNQSPCSWCPMSSVCRFEMGLNSVRFMESLKRSEVFRRLGSDEA